MAPTRITGTFAVINVPLFRKSAQLLTCWMLHNEVLKPLLQNCMSKSINNWKSSVSWQIIVKLLIGALIDFPSRKFCTNFYNGDHGYSWNNWKLWRNAYYYNTYLNWQSLSEALHNTLTMKISIFSPSCIAFGLAHVFLRFASPQAN